MLTALVALTLIFTALDHWTTWWCLRSPVPGWEVTEANPIADWLFGTLGLGPGILLDSALTVLVVALLVATPLLPVKAKSGLLAVIVLCTGWAVMNNVQAILDMGIAPFSGV